MLSIDTNILLYAQNRDCPEHPPARAFISQCATRNTADFESFGFTHLINPIDNTHLAVRDSP